MYALLIEALAAEESGDVVLQAAVTASVAAPDRKRGGVTTCRQGRAVAALRLPRGLLGNLLLVNGYASAPEIESGWHESCDTQDTRCAGDVGVVSP